MLAEVNVYRFSSKEIHLKSGMYYYLYRFYDPNLQRWMNRDPIAEEGGYNLYKFAENDPPNTIDAKGLTIYVCARKSQLPPFANHVYFWDDTQPPYSEGGIPSCGMSGSSGKGTPGNPERDKGPGVDDCLLVPGTDSNSDLAAKIIQCCRATANTGVWFPFINDCHNKVDDCLKHFHIRPPLHPRLGSPRVLNPPAQRPPLRAPKDPYN